MTDDKHSLIRQVIPASGCVLQAWSRRRGDGMGEEVKAHWAILGIALLDNGTTDFMIEMQDEIRLRSEADAWAWSNRGIAPHVWSVGSTSTLVSCKCRGEGTERELISAAQVNDAFDDAAEYRRDHGWLPPEEVAEQ